MTRTTPTNATGAIPIEALIRRARDGDHDALDELFARARPVVARWASQRLARGRPGIDRLSDIAQETALRAFDRFETFSGATEGEWYAWLRAVFHSRADQAFRDAGRLKRDAFAVRPLDSAVTGSVADDQATPSQVVAREQHWRQTLTNIYLLPPDQREAIRRCHLEELSVAEAARLLGKTEAAVAGLLRRGLKTLRERAAGPGTEDPGSDEPSDGAAAALLRFLQERDERASTDVDAFLAEHPEHIDRADELRDMAAWITHIQGIRKRGRG